MQVLWSYETFPYLNGHKQHSRMEVGSYRPDWQNWRLQNYVLLVVITVFMAIKLTAVIINFFLVNGQLDAQFFSMYLFQFSTCFEQPRAHHQENQFYQYKIWYMSVSVGDHFVCRSERNFPTCTRKGHRQRPTYTRCCIDTIDSPNDEHEVARNL